MLALPVESQLECRFPNDGGPSRGPRLWHSPGLGQSVMLGNIGVAPVQFR